MQINGVGDTLSLIKCEIEILIKFEKRNSKYSNTNNITINKIFMDISTCPVFFKY